MSKMPILEEYDKVIRDQEARGMVENVSADDTEEGFTTSHTMKSFEKINRQPDYVSFLMLHQRQ